MKIADPPKFSGDREAYDTWKSEVLYKVDSECEHFDCVGPLAEIQYIASRLNGDAHDSVRNELPMFAPGHLAFKPPKEMWMSLDQYFTDRNRDKRARVDYIELRQGDQEGFSEFLSKFKRYATKLNISE